MQFIGKFPFVESSLRQRVKELEKRSLESPPRWLEDLFGQETNSGIHVNEETALKFSAVWAAVKLLSESAAQLPYQVIRREGSGKSVFYNHPSYSLVHDSPNEYMSKFTFIQTIVGFALLWGNGYARIVKKNAQATALHLLHPSQVQPVLIEDKLFYKIGSVVYPDRDILHVMGFSTDGVSGKSCIQVHKDSIGLGLAAQNFGATFFKNGANSEMVFNTNTNLSDEQYTRLQKVIMSRQSGSENAHKPILLEGGGSVTQLTIPPDQAQFIQTRNFQVTDIARIFGVPPHMIGDLERSTNNNIEQQSIEFVQYSLMPWIIRLEQEFTRKLIWENEKPNVFVEANTGGLMRGDARTRAEYYGKMWQIGTMSANEIRAKENENPIEGGDQYFVPINYQTIERAQSDPNPNTGGDPDGSTE